MKVAVLTDSNSGITQKEAKELGIKVIPMPFNIDGEEYLEDINLTQEEFYKKIIAGAKVSTSQPSIGYVNSVWDDLLQEYDGVVYIPMSSGLSKSYESAWLSSEANYKGKVFVVNNQRISVTQRQSVLDAMELAQRGFSAEEIKEKLEEVKMESDIFITLSTLEYLKKGGRITPAAAALGGMLRLKPILLIKGEKLDKFRMRNTSLERAMDIMIQAIDEKINGYLKDKDGRVDNVHLEAAYAGTDLTSINELVRRLKEKYPNQEIICQPLSLSVSCHIGPGAIAVAISKAIPDSWVK